MPQPLSKISINNFGTKNIYVSGTIGNDAWSGEYPNVNGVSGPVKTLDRVSKLSQALNNSLLNVVINIREGTYSILGTTANPAFYLDNSNNSIVFKSITYKSYNNENVVISGAENISHTAFTQVTAGSPIWNRLKSGAKGNVYQASVSQFDLGWVPDNWHGSFVNNSENGSVGGLPGIPDLIFDDNLMTLARWPNKTTLGSSVFSEYTTISTVVTGGSDGGYPSPRVNGIFTYSPEFDSVIGGWTAAGLSAGIWLYGYWQWDWSSDVFKLLSINTATRQLTVRSNQATYPVKEYTACDVPFPGATAVYDSNPTPRRWFAFNTLEELDSPKEYYIDRTTKMLYFWPPTTIGSTSSIKLTHRALNGAAAYTEGEFTTTTGNTGEIGFNPNTGVPATTGTGIFPYVGWTGADIQGEGYRLVSGLQSRYAQNTKNAITSLFKFYKVKNLTIDGLTFNNSAGSGIELNLCQNVTIKNCHIYNINHTGILSMGGRNNIIDRCKIHDIGMSGIINVGGNRQTLIPANNIVTGCSIKRFALKNDTKHFGLCINGVGNVASYNLIGEGSYGILQSGNNHVIEYNHLYNLIPENDDAGGIYSGRDASHFGKTIRYNFFNNVRSQLPGGTYNDGFGCTGPRTALTMAIYYDDLESYSNIYGNVFYKCGAGSGGAIFFNGGVFHTITNNIFIECIKSVNASQYTVPFWNSTLDAQKWKIINPENFTWYDVDGGPFGPSGGICFATGYNPYTYNQTAYGQQGYQTDANRNGIMPTVNLKSDVYTKANPYYTTMYNVSGGGISLTTDLSFINTIKNTISTNVLVKGPTGAATFVGSGLTVGGFSMGSEMMAPTDPGFVDYANLNFKLTTQGLINVKNVLPTFVDIPFQYIPTTSYDPLNPNVTNTVFVPTQLFGLIENAVVGYWNQGETWGNQAGLTNMWHYVKYPTGILGPKGACLNAGQFPRADGTNAPPDVAEWPGVGNQNIADIDWNISPWNTSTGYIGMTFGSPGFITKPVIDDIIIQFSHVPNKYRTFYPPRSWRAFDGIAGSRGIAGTEYVTIDTLYASNQSYTSPWLKRKINFIRTELNAVYKYMGSSGFTCSHFEFGDEIFDFYPSLGDLRGIGTEGASPNVIAGGVTFYNQLMYPNNSSTGASWYASFNGICAAPDSLIAEGITSYRAFLLNRGFTTNPSNWRYVDGLTALGNCTCSGNIAIGGSPRVFLGQEYYAAWKDWLAYMVNDLIVDFKNVTGISADNSLSNDYNYYRTNAAVHNFTTPTIYGNSAYLSNITKTSSDYIPFPSPTSATDNDQKVTNYYSYNDRAETLGSLYTNFQSKSGDIDSISLYGIANIDITTNNFPLIDRNFDCRGNSYGYVFNGNTFGKTLVPAYDYYGMLSTRFSSNNAMYNQTDARKWLPANYVGTTAPGQLVTCYTCAETLGNCGFFRFDPTGSSGSSAANSVKVGFDRTPNYIGWHLNPLWGINVQTFNGGATIGPANYVPMKGLEMLNGLSLGEISKNRLGSSNTWSAVSEQLDSCGNPFPGNTLPPGTYYNNYWTHWYSVAFMSLLTQIKIGRHIAVVNVNDAVNQRNNPTKYPGITGSNWNGIQKPFNLWICTQKYTGEQESVYDNRPFRNFMYIPQGITFNYTLTTSMATGVTYVYGDVGPMYYEHIRHQYLNKVGKVSYWNPPDFYTTTSVSTITPYFTQNGRFPKYYPQGNTTNPVKVGGLTSFGVCGAMMLSDAKKVDKILSECNTIGNGTVKETLYLAPVNMDERSYLISGAQKADTDFLWRITFAHPATQSPIIVRGSVSGITTAYYVNGITNYIDSPNNKFGIWWNTNLYEIPIVENPPVSEAERLGVLNLPTSPAFDYDPLTMTEAVLIPPEIQALNVEDLLFANILGSNEGNYIGTEQAKWSGLISNVVAAFQGSRTVGNANFGVASGVRAYPYESDPVNPLVSSPWHNAVYECAINPYLWGIKSFYIYMPFGIYPFTFGLTYQKLKDTLTGACSDPAFSPCRWKGFTSSIRALLEGTLTPAGMTAINKPSNVHLYLQSLNGWHTYRNGGIAGTPSGSTYYPGSLAYWDDCFAQTGTSAGANNLYYQKLNSYVDDMISIKSPSITAGILSVNFDATAPSATPNTVHLFQTIPAQYTRGNSYELGDWYVAERFKAAGIPVYCEARPANVYSIANSGFTLPMPSSGLCGSTAISQWRNHISEEYWLWFSDPASGDPNFTNIQGNTAPTSVFRGAMSNGPVPPEKDPYKSRIRITNSGAGRTLSWSPDTGIWQYTPHGSLFKLYGLSDVFRKFNNVKNPGLNIKGIAFDNFSRGVVLQSLDEFNRGGTYGGKVLSAGMNNSSLTGYYQLDCELNFLSTRGGSRLFNQAAFVANPSGYTGGYWTPTGLDFWKLNVQQTSLTGFIQMINALGNTAAPQLAVAEGWTGKTYPNDFYSLGTVTSELRS